MEVSLLESCPLSDDPGVLPPLLDEFVGEEAAFGNVEPNQGLSPPDTLLRGEYRQAVLLYVSRMTLTIWRSAWFFHPAPLAAIPSL